MTMPICGMNSTSSIMSSYKCRLCLKKTLTRINILEGDFSKMIEILTNIKVSENDGLPKYSCTKCAQDVKIALITKKRIIKSHKALIEHLKRKQVRIQEQFTFNNIENEKKRPVVEHTYEEGPENESEQHSIKGTIEFVNVDSTIVLGPVMSHGNEDEQGSEQNDVDKKNVANGITKVHNLAKNQKQFVCEQCNLTFNLREKYRLHRKKHNKTKCTICENLIRSDNFKKHALMHERKRVLIGEQHAINTISNSKPKRRVVVNCNIKDSKDESKPDLIKGTIMSVDVGSTTPLETVSSIENDDESSEQNGADANIKNVAEVIVKTAADDFINKDNLAKNQKCDITEFVCEQCNLTFDFRYEYQNHKMKHKKKKCTICNKFIRCDNFKKHFLAHNSPLVYCEVCGAKYKNGETLRHHISMYHKNKANWFVCEECGKNFRNTSDFVLHKKKHTGLRAFKCETCGKAFFTNANLKNHDQMTHKKLRPYVCEFCPATFSKPYGLKTHRRQHTNEKPYICEFCNEGFKQKISMRTHMKSKHGYVEPKGSVCQQCGKGFASAFALNIHERLHSAPEKCKLCSNTFTDQVYLQNHLKQVHGVETDNVGAEEDTVERVE